MRVSPGSLLPQDDLTKLKPNLSSGSQMGRWAGGGGVLGGTLLHMGLLLSHSALVTAAHSAEESSSAPISWKDFHQEFKISVYL